MVSIADMLFGHKKSEEILELFCKENISQEEAKKVADSFVETNAKNIVNTLDSECPKGLGLISYDAELPEELFTDGFIIGGYTHMVGKVIAKAHPGYKLDSVSGSGMVFKKE
jgi:hypothetical protein